MLLVFKSEMSGLAAPYYFASAPATADALLYLNLDGVVQHEPMFWHPRRGTYVSPTVALDGTLFEWVPQLEEALASLPDVALVLSSTCFIRHSFEKTLKNFPAGLRSKFIGGTFHRRWHGADPWLLESYCSTPRGLQIWADVQRGKPRHWLALDDDEADWPSFPLENLVACDGSTRLSCPGVQRQFRQELIRCQQSLVTGADIAFAP